MKYVWEIFQTNINCWNCQWILVVFFTIHLLILNALAHTSCSDSGYILLSLTIYEIYSSPWKCLQFILTLSFPYLISKHEWKNTHWLSLLRNCALLYGKLSQCVAVLLAFQWPFMVLRKEQIKHLAVCIHCRQHELVSTYFKS